MKMKLKSSVLTVIIAVGFLHAGSVVRAQGLYNDKDHQTENRTVGEATEKTEATNTESTGGMFRAGGGGGDSDPAPGTDSPVGEGFLILSVFSGAYAFVKRNIRKKT
jgi:hypothetical protein